MPVTKIKVLLWRLSLCITTKPKSSFGFRCSLKVWIQFQNPKHSIWIVWAINLKSEFHSELCGADHFLFALSLSRISSVGFTSWSSSPSNTCFCKHPMRLSEHKQRGLSSSAHPMMMGFLSWRIRLWGWMHGCSCPWVDGLLVSWGMMSVVVLSGPDCPNCVCRLQEHPSLSIVGQLWAVVGKSTPVKYFTSLLLIAILNQDVTSKNFKHTWIRDLTRPLPLKDLYTDSITAQDSNHLTKQFS